MKLIRDMNGNVVQVVRINQATTQVVDGTSATTQSTVIDANADSLVRIAATADIYIAIGTNPTASATTILLPAGSVEWFEIPAAAKIAVFGGKANITRA